MLNLGKSIRLFLVDGSPTGLITAEIGNWTGKVLTFSRAALLESLQRPELKSPGVYFLVGPSSDYPGQTMVYVGESDDVATRLKQHETDPKMEFFEQVALVVSKDENLTKSHVRYLEYKLIEKIRAIGATVLKNGNKGGVVSLPESELADMGHFLQQLQVLLPVLGFSFVQDVPRRAIQAKSLDPESTMSESPTFELSFLGGKIQAKAYESDGQFVVLAGSTCRHPLAATEALKSERYTYILSEIRESLDTGVLEAMEATKGDIARLTRDKAFKSPSRAASFICGTPVSGHAYWQVQGTGQRYGDWRVEKMQDMAVSEE